MSDTDSGLNKCFTNMFEVQIQQNHAKDIFYVSPLSATIPAIECSDGLNFNYVTFRPGLPQYGNVVFRMYEHPETFPAIKEWVLAAYNGDPCTKDMTVIVKNQAMEPVRTFDLLQVWPCSLRGLGVAAGQENGVTMVHELEVVVNRMKIS